MKFVVVDSKHKVPAWGDDGGQVLDHFPHVASVVYDAPTVHDVKVTQSSYKLLLQQRSGRDFPCLLYTSDAADE